MIHVDQIHKSFGAVRAVQGISFELLPGQVLGLLGPNGAGKTTTIRMIVGYLMPDRGRILIDGQDTIEAPAKARALMGYMPESTPLYPEMKVHEYLEYRGRLWGLSRADRTKRAGAVIDRCRLSDMRSRRISTLSKGYRQRVGLASALLHDPKVLVLDEPTNGLDPAQIREVRELVQELGKERAMIVSSHILPEVERLCDRLIIIAGGQVRGDGTAAQLTKTASLSIYYTLSFRNDNQAAAETFLASLRALPTAPKLQVSQSTPDPTWTNISLTAHHQAPDLREPIAHAAQQSGVFLRELHAQPPTLERIFHALIDEVPAKEGA